MLRIAWIFTIFCVAGLAATFHFSALKVDFASIRSRAAVPARAPATAPPVRVSVASARAEDVPIYLTGIGTVQAYNTVNVKSRVDGEIVKVLFGEGQDVNAGDPLIIIDPRPFAAQLQQQEAMLRKDQAQLKGALLDLQRYETLTAKDFAATKQQLDQQRTLVDTTRAQIQTDEALIDYAKTQLEYTTVRAPISGRTGIRQIDQGNIILSTDTAAIVVLTQLKPITVVFTIASSLVAQARMTLGRARVPVIAYGSDFVTPLDHGTIDLVDNQVDPTTGTIKLKASFPNADLKLWPGNFVNGRIIVDTKRQGLTVPSAALRHGPRGDFVWIVRRDKTVEARGVTAGQALNGRTLIARGLSRNEQVVIDGHFLLDNGRSVEIVDPDRQDAQAGAEFAVDP